MAQQKRDPETGKFISRSDFFAKYPQGLTAEQYQHISDLSKRMREAKAELDKAIEEHLESADKQAEENPEAMPTAINYSLNESMYGPMYDDDDKYAIRGCLAAFSIMLIGIGISLITIFAIFGE